MQALLDAGCSVPGMARLIPPLDCLLSRRLIARARSELPLQRFSTQHHSDKATAACMAAIAPAMTPPRSCASSDVLPPPRRRLPRQLCGPKCCDGARAGTWPRSLLRGSPQQPILRPTGSTRELRQRQIDATRRTVADCPALPRLAGGTFDADRHRQLTQTTAHRGVSRQSALGWEASMQCATAVPVASNRHVGRSASPDCCGHSPPKSEQ